jgi:hypothetical protein
MAGAIAQGRRERDGTGKISFPVVLLILVFT